MEKQRRSGAKWCHERCFSLRPKIPLLSLFFPRILMRLEKFGLTIKEQKQPTKTTLVYSRQRSHNSALCRKNTTGRTFLFPRHPPATASLQLEKLFYFFRRSSSKRHICRCGEPPPQRQGSRRRWHRRSDPDPASWPALAGMPWLTTLGSPVCNLHTSRDQYQTSQ